MFISPIFRRFKIYSCPHCSDKYCTQEDLERHLLKVITHKPVTHKPTSLCPNIKLICVSSTNWPIHKSFEFYQGLHHQVEKNNIVKGVPTTVTPVAKEPQKVTQEQTAADAQVLNWLKFFRLFCLPPFSTQAAETEKEGELENNEKPAPVKVSFLSNYAKVLHLRLRLLSFLIHVSFF